MIDNEFRQQYRQAVDDLKTAFRETCLCKLYEGVVMRLNKVGSYGLFGRD